MPVMRGKVVKRGLYIQVEGGKHVMPKGCDPIIGPQLAKLAGQEVELLMVKDVILAIRPLKVNPEIKFKIITCYLCPPYIVFAEEIMHEINPVITKSLVASGYLDRAVVKELDAFEETAVR